MQNKTCPEFHIYIADLHIYITILDVYITYFPVISSFSSDLDRSEIALGVIY